LKARTPIFILKRVVMLRRFIKVAVLLGFGLGLASCGGGAGGASVAGNTSGGDRGSQFADYVADHWPRWAGGMPDDVPPRPGTPGYDEFITHGQAKPASATAAAPGAKTAAAKAKTVARPAPAPAPSTESVAPVAPADDQPAEDSSVVKGGLY